MVNETRKKHIHTHKENNIEFTIDKNRCNSFTKYDYAYYLCRNNKPKKYKYVRSLKRKNMMTVMYKHVTYWRITVLIDLNVGMENHLAYCKISFFHLKNIYIYLYINEMKLLRNALQLIQLQLMPFVALHASVLSTAICVKYVWLIYISYNALEFTRARTRTKYTNNEWQRHSLSLGNIVIRSS